MRERGTAWAVIAFTGASLAWAAAPAAHATFPGRNGDILFALSRETQDPMTENCVFCIDRPLYALNPRHQEVRRVPTCTQRECNDTDPAAGPEGQRIVFEREQYDPDRDLEPFSVLATANRDGSDVQIIDEGGRLPAWAPSGMRFAYQDRAADGRSEIFIYDERQGEVRQLTFGGGSGPDWSSRGRIAFTRPEFRDGRFTGRFRLYSVWPNGRGLRLITRVGTPSLPNWSPTGRSLVYTDLGRRRDGIYKIRADGSRRRRLTRSSGYWPVWSPNGKRIAFNRSFQSIMVMRRDGSRLRRLYAPRRTVTSPLGRISWSVAPGRRG